MLDLANMVIAATNSNSRIVFSDLPQDDPLMRRPDIQRARDRLDWSPKIPLRNGLGRTIEYFSKALARKTNQRNAVNAAPLAIAN